MDYVGKCPTIYTNAFGWGGVGSELLEYTVEPLHNGHLGDRRKWPLWRGGHYGEVGVKYDTFFSGSTTCLLCQVHVAYNGNPILNNIYR